jgi:hypothetical protein
MNTADALVKSIFQRESLQDCSLDELQAIAREYPYFVPVQLLLAEKLRTNNNASYNEQLKKISLHFNNPLWLDFLLNGSKTEPMTGSENKNANSNKAIDREVRQEYLNTPDTEALKSEAEIIEPLKEENNNVAKQEIITDSTTDGKPEYAETISGQAIQSETELHEVNTEAPLDENAGVSENDITEEYREDKAESPGDVNTNSQPAVVGETEQKNDEPPLTISQPELNQEPEQNEITFEPYHTVDYFASQGHSVTESEVSTEAMAEVWLKQGNREKAIEIYNKLSLLNPAKSAYFASLAEQLKNS